MDRILTTVVMMSISLGVAGAAQRVVLVQEGEPAAVIVLGKQPNPVAFEAARELVRVIERISGAELPVYLENEWQGGMEGPCRSMTRIFVGDSRTAREAGLDLSDLPPENFPRPPKNTHPALILAGRDDAKQNWGWRGHRANRYLRGTAYAVYAFLQDALGVRWLWPGRLGEVVPRMDTIAIEPIDRTGAPKLAKRIFRNMVGYWSGEAFSARPKVGTSTAAWVRLAHESDLWLDHLGMGDSRPELSVTTEGRVGWVEKFGKDHPEWFAMQSNGERLVKELLGRVRICLSNPEVIDRIVTEADEFFRQHPDRVTYGIELSDVFGSYCQCPRCRAWGPTLSDTVARHWAAIGEKVAARHPDKLLYAHPYHRYIDPPQSVKRLPDNIVLFPVGKNLSGYTAEKDREASRRSWLGWARLNRQKMVWRPNYPSNEIGLPLNYTHQLAEDLKLFYANKLMGVDIDNMRRLWSGTGLNYYVACKLVWDPRRDVDAIIDDYCKKGFAPAHKQVRAYFDQVERLTQRIAAHQDTGPRPMGISYSSGIGMAIHYPPEVTGKLHRLLDEADRAAGGNQTVKRRIAFLRVAVTYAELEYKVVAAGRRADKGGLSPAEIEAIRALLARRRTFLRSQAATWHIEPEKSWRRADWIEKILVEEEQAAQGKDLFADLGVLYDEVAPIPEDWLFKTDPAAVGVQQRWFAKDHDESDFKPIKVGDFWERQGYADYDGIAWYRRRITLPASLKGKKVIVSFGAADENALVYIDGQEAGKFDIGPEGWDRRFELDLTGHVKPGVEQTWAIRVIDSVGAGGLWKPIKVFTPKPAGRHTLVLTPTKDTYLRRNYPTTAHGKSESLAVGSKDYFRTLIAWELPATLAGVKVRSARIILSLRYSSGGSYAVYPFPTDWHERTATWNDRRADHPWAGGAGGKLPKTPIARATLPKVLMKDAEQAAQPPKAVFDVTEHVAGLGPEQTDFGVIIVQDPPEARTNFSPHSREAQDPKVRPRLEIEYELTASSFPPGAER